MAEISEGFCVAACMFTPEKLAKEIKAAKDPKKGLSFNSIGKLNMQLGYNDFSASDVINKLDELE